jgi:hypothetical protein
MNRLDTLPAARSDTSPAQTSLAPSPAARLAALGAVAGPVLFTLAWLVLGFLSPGYTIYGTRIAPYSPISQPVSGLGMGVTAPYMNAAFVFGAGLLTMIGVVGVFATLHAYGGRVRRAICAGLLCLSRWASGCAGSSPSSPR